MSVFRRYVPDEPLILSGFEVLYLQNDAGDDWYEYQKSLSGQVVQVNESGLIVSVAKDSSLLFPENCEVFEYSGTVEIGYVWNGSIALADLVGDRLREITSRLGAIDNESARPLRAIQTGNDVHEDHQKLQSLEAEASALRDEFRALNEE